MSSTAEDVEGECLILGLEGIDRIVGREEASMLVVLVTGMMKYCGKEGFGTTK